MHLGFRWMVPRFVPTVARMLECSTYLSVLLAPTLNHLSMPELAPLRLVCPSRSYIARGMINLVALPAVRLLLALR